MLKSFLLFAGLLAACMGFTDPAPHTLLWKISGNGLKKPSYLFGTMHVLCADDASLSDSLKGVIGRVDQVYFEIDLSDLTAMLSAMKYMQMHDNKKLSDLLPDKDYAKVKDYFAKHNSTLPFGMLERFKPLLISSLIEEQSLACQTTDGMEMMIMKEMHLNNKPVKGLETVAFQAGLFDSIPYDKQAKDLVNYIDSAEEYKQMTRDLASIYKKQDLEMIDSLSRKGDPGMNGYMDLLLYDRNRKWAGALDTLLAGKSLLVAVGAAHLPGDQGVINLLRKRGYTLSPVKN
jgi:uncharacterized protein